MAMTEYQKQYYKSPTGKKKKKEYNKIYNQSQRLKILNHYTVGKIPQCSCCGDTILEFLTLDHLNGNGVKHRKMVGQGNVFYNWVIKNNFPRIFRILCMNCNHSLGHYGYCPHSK